MLWWHRYGTEPMRQWSTRNYITLEKCQIFTLYCTACVSTCSADSVPTFSSLNSDISSPHLAWNRAPITSSAGQNVCFAFFFFFFFFYLQGVGWLCRILLCNFHWAVLAGWQPLAVSHWFEQHLEPRSLLSKHHNVTRGFYQEVFSGHPDTCSRAEKTVRLPDFPRSQVPLVVERRRWENRSRLDGCGAVPPCTWVRYTVGLQQAPPPSERSSLLPTVCRGSRGSLCSGCQKFLFASSELVSRGLKQ